MDRMSEKAFSSALQTLPLAQGTRALTLRLRTQEQLRWDTSPKRQRVNSGGNHPLTRCLGARMAINRSAV